MKPCLVQESDVSAKVRQSCSSDPFSLQSKQLQPDYVSSHNNIKEFLDKLESEGKEDWQIRQAYKAIKVFLEDFMCLLIDFTEDSENGSTCKPVKKPK